MIYEMTGAGLKKAGVYENDKKNNLPVGTVLRLNGYNDPDYVIVKNLGVSPDFPGYGAKYLVVGLENHNQTVKQAYHLKYLSEKQDNRIQIYITDRIIPAGEVLEIWEKSEAKRKASKENRGRISQEADRKEKIGRELFKKYIPEDTKALIVAVHETDKSDVQSDYFAVEPDKMIILGYSKHTRDLFSEMRKHAGKIPETAHLGTGCGHFEPRVIIASDNLETDGVYYRQGQYSPWHRELTHKDGRLRAFTTRKEAEDYIREKGELGPFCIDGKRVAFAWRIEEEKIEHREKYSMGRGYYLKDGGYDTGWKVEKIRKWGEDWQAGVYVSLADRCIFEG